MNLITFASDTLFSENKNMRILTFILFLLLTPAAQVQAQTADLLGKLDATLDKRDQYTKEKQQRIQLLKSYLASTRDPRLRLHIYQQLYDQYYVLNYDSAAACVNNSYRLAEKVGDRYYSQLSRLEKAELYSIAGMYSEAEDLLDSIGDNGVEQALQLRNYLVRFRLYSYWANYCSNEIFSPKYSDRASAYLRKAMPLMDKSSPEYVYFKGEYEVYVEKNDAKARRYYLKAIKRLPKASRYYAMTAFALALNYLGTKDTLNYERYLVEASCSDIICSTKENLALQNLATYLFKYNKDQINNAVRYINISMDDAKSYNARLRILEISQKLPTIVSSYESILKQRNNILTLINVAVALLAVLLMSAIYYIFRQNKKMALQRRQLADNYQKLSVLNSQLGTDNTELLNTNIKRDRLVKLYIDLCAKFINRLNNYTKLVRRKIIANQVKDLLSTVSSSRLSEEDATTFRTNFDKCFLALYPTFKTELNSLLTDDGQLDDPGEDKLSNEQRIYALIRLGVKESSEIASVLFFSPQTIYNYRSSVKKKAKNKEDFDGEVGKICVSSSGPQPGA